jgi:hypothetical protein
MADVISTTYTASGTLKLSDSIFTDIDGLITNISPDKTPFIASIGTGKAVSTYHEWLTDTLKLPTGVNYAVEGADAVSAAVSPPARVGSHCQIVQDTFTLSATAEAVKMYGRTDEHKYHLTKSLKYLSTEIETACINNTADAPGDSATPRQTKGLEGWVQTNDMSFSSYAATNAFSDTILMQMMQAAYRAGGSPTKLLVAPDQARKVAAWNQDNRITVLQNAEEQALTMSVMKLITPFGRVDVVLDLWITQDTNASTQYDRVYLYEPDKLEVAWLRPIRTNELARTGDSRKYQSVGEFCFVCRAEKAQAKCKKCSTS